VLEVVLYGSIHSIQQGKEGMKIEALFGTIFEALLEDFSCCSMVVQYIGTVFEVLFLWVGRTIVRIWHAFLGIHLEGKFGCCKWFSLGFKCIVVADISFLNLIKSLSLSMGFTTLGFSLALPKFMSFYELNGCCSLCLFHCKNA
jgi:hypothetical protein